MEEFKAEDLPAEPTPSEPLVAAHQDTGHSEFPVPAASEEEPDDWSSLLADAGVPATPAEEAAPVEDEIGQHRHELLPGEEPTALPVPEHAEIAAEGQEPALEEPQAAVPETPSPQPEIELDQEFELVLEPEAVIPAHEMFSQMPPPADGKACAPKQEKSPEPVSGQMFSSDQFLSDLAKIDEFGLDELTPGCPTE